jgi:hypothetical protein
MFDCMEQTNDCEHNYCTTCPCKCVHVIIKDNSDRCDHRCSNFITESNDQMIDMKKNDMGNMLKIMNKNTHVIKKDLRVLSNELENMDEKTNQQVDSLQDQINMISKSYMEIFDEMTEENNTAKILVNEINRINETLDTMRLNCCPEYKYKECCIMNQQKKIFTDTTIQHVLQIPDDVNIIFITCCGGGGAGGCGFIENMFYYSGGGGGGGASIINRPMEVIKGTVITIRVGRGGSCLNERQGEDTVIKINIPHIDEYVIKAQGGENGYPRYNAKNNNFKEEGKQEYSVNGGKGGTCYLPVYNGCNGMNGNISIPSFVSGNPGNGGSSTFCTGGLGGGSIFSPGGTGGCIGTWENKKETICNMNGQPGKYGSGGGGSVPRSKIIMTESISGNGGDGIVIIEYQTKNCCNPEFVENNHHGCCDCDCDC